MGEEQLAIPDFSSVFLLLKVAAREHGAVASFVVTAAFGCGYAF